MSLDDLVDYCSSEGRELNRYAAKTARRAEDLAEFRGQSYGGMACLRHVPEPSPLQLRSRTVFVKIVTMPFHCSTDRCLITRKKTMRRTRPKLRR